MKVQCGVFAGEFVQLFFYRNFGRSCKAMRLQNRQNTFKNLRFSAFFLQKRGCFRANSGRFYKRKNSLFSQKNVKACPVFSSFCADFSCEFPGNCRLLRAEEWCSGLFSIGQSRTPRSWPTLHTRTSGEAVPILIRQPPVSLLDDVSINNITP